MGAALIKRLLDAGHDVAVYNRTRSKAEALVEFGATVVDSPADLASRGIVFTMVGGSDDFKEVAIGAAEACSSQPNAAPYDLIDSTTISQAASDERCAPSPSERGASVLAAPVSGNAKVVAAGADPGGLGAQPAFRVARHLLDHFARGSPTSARATAPGWSRSATT